MRAKRESPDLTGLWQRASFGSMNPITFKLRVRSGWVTGLAGCFVLGWARPSVGAETSANFTQPRVSDRPVLLVPARVFDGEEGKTHEGWVVLVKSNKI